MTQQKDSKKVVVKVSYKELMREAEKPASERASIAKARSGHAKPRRYHMSANSAKNHRKEFNDTGKFYNPFRGGGKYHAFIQSLIDLGINKPHPFNVVRDKMRDLLNKVKTVSGKNAWEVFQAVKKGSGSDKAMDVRGRIIQNAKVLQRLTGQHPYGWKLAQLHACVDIKLSADGVPQFILNTNFKTEDSVSPLNEMKGHRRSKMTNGQAQELKKAAASKKAAKKAVKKTAKKVAKKAVKKTVKKASKKAIPPVVQSPDNDVLETIASEEVISDMDESSQLE